MDLIINNLYLGNIQGASTLHLLKNNVITNLIYICM